MTNKTAKSYESLMPGNMDSHIKTFLGDEALLVIQAARDLFERLSPDQAIDLLERKLLQMKNCDQVGMFPLTLKIKRILTAPEAKHILTELNPGSQLEVYSELPDPENYADKIIQGCQTATQHDWILFLERIRWKTPKDGKLNRFFTSHYLKVTPGMSFRQTSTIDDQAHTNVIPIQEVITFHAFDQFFSHIRSAVKPPSFKVLWAADEVRKDLTNEDVSLAREWATHQFVQPVRRNNRLASGESNPQQGEIENAVFAKMLSARCAEKAALFFYRSLNYSVKDVSITQLNCPSGDWQTHDLELKQSEASPVISVDVKNARTPVNNRNRYVEHCVPRFKQNRWNRSEVRIFGVLSPYITPNRMATGNFEAEGGFSKPDTTYIRVLGEVTCSSIYQYTKNFSAKNFLIQHSKNAVSPWMFDYSDTFYETQKESRDYLRQLDEGDIPDWNICKSRSINPIPAFLAIKKPLPETWNESLQPWQIDFVNELYRNTGDRVNLPILYLTILKHFLKMCVCEEPGDYRPSSYRPMIFPNWLIEEVDGEPIFKSPLGIFDPLSLITDFIGTLSSLWGRSKEIHLDQFSYFRFNGLGLLEGKRTGEDEFVTIIAYCGGEIDQKGKCGFSPLIIGVDKVEPCKECGKLVCTKCGFCSDPKKCSLCAPRMKEVQIQNQKARKHLNEYEEEWEANIPEPPEEPPFDLAYDSSSPEEEIPF